MCRNPTSTATTGISQVSRENEARKRKEKLKKRRKETRRKRGKHDKGGVWTAHTKQEFFALRLVIRKKGDGWTGGRTWIEEEKWTHFLSLSSDVILAKILRLSQVVPNKNSIREKRRAVFFFPL